MSDLLIELSSFTAIFTGGILSGMYIYAKYHEPKVIEWEYKHLWNPLKRAVRNLLRKSKRIVAWAEQPSKHGTPDEDWITGQVKVFGDVWR